MNERPIVVATGVVGAVRQRARPGSTRPTAPPRRPRRRQRPATAPRPSRSLVSTPALASRSTSRPIHAVDQSLTRCVAPHGTPRPLGGGPCEARARESRSARLVRRQRRATSPGATRATPTRSSFSEVMLQQTQVDRVVPRYRRWLERWPTVEALAAATAGRGDPRVAGARLQPPRRQPPPRGAGRRRDGWPDDLTELPGVGPYTAAAIANFAFGRDVLPVDTNVRRVQERTGESFDGVVRPGALRPRSDRLPRPHPPLRRLPARRGLPFAREALRAAAPPVARSRARSASAAPTALSVGRERGRRRPDAWLAARTGWWHRRPRAPTCRSGSGICSTVARTRVGPLGQPAELPPLEQRDRLGREALAAAGEAEPVGRRRADVDLALADRLRAGGAASRRDGPRCAAPRRRARSRR